MMVKPGIAGSDLATTMGLAMAELALWSVVVAWFFERSGRSMAVAIAFHASAHLDNVSRAPEDEIRLRVLRFAVVAIAAGVAAWALVVREQRREATRQADAA